MHLLPALVVLVALSGAGATLAQTAGGRNAAVSTETASRWSRLPANQKLALQPLGTEWDGLGEAHRRKWLAMARNFDRMSPQEQATLHSRMTDWAALSPRERVRARLNFAEVQRLAPESERKAKWEAYRALTEEERKALAERATPTPRGTALPVRPVARERLAPVPPAALQGGHGGPRIALTPAAPRPPAAVATPAPVARPTEPSSSAAPAHTLVTPPTPAEPPTAPAAESPSSDQPGPGRPFAP